MNGSKMKNVNRLDRIREAGAALLTVNVARHSDLEFNSLRAGAKEILAASVFAGCN
jgi:hypothetical protein